MYNWTAMSILETIIVFAFYVSFSALCYKVFSAVYLDHITVKKENKLAEYRKAFADGYRTAKTMNSLKETSPFNIQPPTK